MRGPWTGDARTRQRSPGDTTSPLEMVITKTRTPRATTVPYGSLVPNANA